MSEEFFHGYTPVAAGNQNYLERPRINQLLERAVQNPIVSVVAGAGYGKSYAVYSFVRKYNVRTAWIQCSERDNVGERFWENFISAISIINEKTARKLLELGFPATEQQFSQHLKTVRNDAIPNEKYIFVYDDIHLITDKTVLRFMEHLLTSPFPNISFILISRSEPALNLEKRMSKKAIERITEDDLRFSRNEMVSYFSLRHITPAPQTASAIYHETEGWAFAIQLAFLSLRNASEGTLRQGPAEPRFPSGWVYIPQALRTNTFKLIESEMMAGLSSQLRRFLIKLSLIEHFNRDLLREIEKDYSIIKEMEEIGSFIRYDSYLNSYHIHHLLLDYLRERQNELSGEEKKDVWTKAALWCAANNLKMDAIAYYEKIGDYDDIVKILNTLPLLLHVRMARFIFDILNRAPETIFQGRIETIEMYFRTLSSLGLFEQGHRETLDALQELKARSESTEKHRFLMSAYFTLGFTGLIQSIHTRRYDFIDYFREASIEWRNAGYTAKAPLNGIALSSYVCRVSAPASKKEIEEYIDVIAKIAPYAMEALGGCMSGMYELARGEFAFFRGEHEEAEKQLLSSLKEARKKQQYEIENRALFYLLRIYLYRGNSDELENILKQLETQLGEDLYMNRYFYHDIVSGWYYIQTGREEKIAPWLKSDYEESELNNIAQGLEKLVKAKYYFSEKRYPAALAVIENRGETELILFGDIEMKVLEAVCRYRQSDRAGAFRALGEAYRLAVPAGFFVPFAELGKDMRSLAEAAIRDTAAGDTTAGKEASGLPPEWLDEICRNTAVYAKKLYRQTGQPGKRGSRTLSHREKEVLIGLSQGLTREEIAGAASISPNTVKSVTRSIYNKLGALNHADAVRIATEKGIL